MRPAPRPSCRRVFDFTGGSSPALRSRGASLGSQRVQARSDGTRHGPNRVISALVGSHEVNLHSCLTPSVREPLDLWIDGLPCLKPLSGVAWVELQRVV